MSGSQVTVPLVVYCVPLRELLPNEVDEPPPLNPDPPLPVRVTPALVLAVGNNPARASATRATAPRYCASYVFRFWFDISTMRSRRSSSGS